MGLETNRNCSSRHSLENFDYSFRNLPLAIMIGIPMVTILYVLCNVSYLTLLNPVELHTAKAVAVSWASKVAPEEYATSIGDYIPFIVSFLVACSTFGAANGSLFTSGR